MIYLHSKQAGFFDDAALEIAQTLASQAAVAFGNANRYQEQLQVAERLRRRAGALTKLSDNNSFMNFDQPIEQSLPGIAVGIRDATPFGTVLISLVESGTRLLRGVVGAGFSQEMLAAIMTRKQPLSSVQQLFKPQFRIGRSYFIPVDQTPVIATDVLRIPFEGRVFSLMRRARPAVFMNTVSSNAVSSNAGTFRRFSRLSGGILSPDLI